MPDLRSAKNIILISDGVNDYSGGISESDIYTELKKCAHSRLQYAYV